MWSFHWSSESPVSSRPASKLLRCCQNLYITQSTYLHIVVFKRVFILYNPAKTGRRGQKWLRSCGWPHAPPCSHTSPLLHPYPSPLPTLKEPARRTTMDSTAEVAPAPVQRRSTGFSLPEPATTAAAAGAAAEKLAPVQRRNTSSLGLNFSLKVGQGRGG